MMLLHQQFVKMAKMQPKKLAIKDKTTGSDVTYGRALIGALILSKKFKQYDPGYIGIMIPTSAGCSLATVGALMSGRIPVMINYSTGAEKNARYAQEKCNFKTIITSKALLDKIQCPVIEGMVLIEDIMKSVSTGDKLKAALRTKLPLQMILNGIHKGGEDDTIAILFTSGSEKDPKAVQLTHNNILSNINSVTPVFNFRSDDIFICTLPFFHVFGLTVNLWLPVFHGMTMLTYPNPLDFKKVCTIVRKHKATFLVGTPSFFWGYLRKSEKGDFDSLRIALTGADKCPEGLREGFKKKHGITVYEGYGATECSPVISTNTPDYNRPGSVGKPIPGLEVRIENYETGEECAPGEDGRILVKGKSVMKGYFNDFEQTSLHIRRGWYDTGDMGNIDEDGYLWHVGRLKRFVKIGGEMVSLVKIEDVLEKFLPEDNYCCVVEIPDATKGAKIVAVLTCPVDEKTVLKQMAEHLPAIALPKTFLVWETLPKMGSGKIDFRSISEMVREQLDRNKIS